MSDILTIEVPSAGHRYDGDFMRRAAYEHAMASGETKVCLVLVKRDGFDPIQVVVNGNAKEASIVLPVPTDVMTFDFGTAVVFPGEIYLVTGQNPEMVISKAGKAFPQSDVIIVTLDRESAFITAADYRLNEDHPILIGRSAEAAAAAAIVLHQDLENGTMESTIGQPGGILEIGMRKENGKVTGLSAGGPVEFS